MNMCPLTVNMRYQRERVVDGKHMNTANIRRGVSYGHIGLRVSTEIAET